MTRLIVYDSLTGNVKRFVEKLGYRSCRIEESLIVDEPFYLVTYTIGFGQVPLSTLRFLKENSPYLLAVASSGNRNWGDNFARAARVISEQFSVPVLHTFELSGTVDDVSRFLEEVERFEQPDSKLG